MKTHKSFAVVSVHVETEIFSWKLPHGYFFSAHRGRWCKHKKICVRTFVDHPEDFLYIQGQDKRAKLRCRGKKFLTQISEVKKFSRSTPRIAQRPTWIWFFTEALRVLLCFKDWFSFSWLTFFIYLKERNLINRRKNDSAVHLHKLLPISLRQGLLETGHVKAAKVRDGKSFCLLSSNKKGNFRLEHRK